MQGTRSRALDSNGRPVRGMYQRDGRFIAGFRCPQTNRWRMVTLDAYTLTEARRERDSILAGLREGRTRAPADVTVETVFLDWQEARNLADRTRDHERHLFRRHLDAIASRRVQDVTAAEARTCPAVAPRQIQRVDAGSRLPARQRHVRPCRPARNARRDAGRRARPAGDSEAAKRANGRGTRRRPASASRRCRIVGTLARRSRPRRIRRTEARRDPRASLAGREPRRRDAHRRTVDAAGRNREASEDRGGHPGRPDPSGPAPPACRVAATVAAHTAGRSRRRHRGRLAGSGAQRAPRPGRREDDREAGRDGGAALMAFTSSLLPVGARDRWACRNHARRSRRTLRSVVHVPQVREGRPRRGSGRRRRTRARGWRRIRRVSFAI